MKKFIPVLLLLFITKSYGQDAYSKYQKCLESIDKQAIKAKEAVEDNWYEENPDPKKYATMACNDHGPKFQCRKHRKQCESACSCANNYYQEIKSIEAKFQSFKNDCENNYKKQQIEETAKVEREKKQRAQSLNSSQTNNNSQQYQQGQKKQELENIKEQQLALLNQQKERQETITAQTNDLINGITDLIVGNMIKKAVREDETNKSKRFTELESQLRNKNGELVDCKDCDGNGYNRCKDCDGSGSKTVTYSTDGKKEVCYMCRGTGNKQCFDCRGTGKVFKENNTNDYSSTIIDNDVEDNNKNQSKNKLITESKKSNIEEIQTKGLEAYFKKDYKTALDLFKEAFELSDGKIGGSMLAETYRVTNDNQNYIITLQKLSDKGDIVSISSLADAYREGKVTTKNISKSIELYKKAAIKGSKEAMYCLGNLYENGEGVPKNFEIAMDWYIKSCDNDFGDLTKDNTFMVPSAKAMEAIGRVYEKGLGVKLDLYKSLNWYRKSLQEVQKGVRGYLFANNQGAMTIEDRGDSQRINESIQRVENKLTK